MACAYDVNGMWPLPFRTDNCQPIVSDISDYFVSINNKLVGMNISTAFDRIDCRPFFMALVRFDGPVFVVVVVRSVGFRPLQCACAFGLAVNCVLKFAVRYIWTVYPMYGSMNGILFGS